MGEIESDQNRVLKKENKSMKEVIQSPSRGKASSLSVPRGYQGRGSKSLISHDVKNVTEDHVIKKEKLL